MGGKKVDGGVTGGGQDQNQSRRQVVASSVASTPIRVQTVEDEDGNKRNVRLLDSKTMLELTSTLKQMVPQYSFASKAPTQPIAQAKQAELSKGGGHDGKEEIISVLDSDI